MLKQTQGNPFEKHARPSGGGRQPPVWTWFAQGDDGPKRPARNTWLQDGAQATSGNFIERREREQVLHQPRGAPEHSSPTVAVSVETVENLLNTLVADARARFDAFAGEAAAAVSAAGTGSPPRVAPEPRVPEYVAAERAAAEASWGYSAGRAAKSRYGDEYGALYEARAAAEHARDRLHPRWVDEEDYSSTVSTGSSFGSDSGDAPPRRPSRRDEAEAELREAGAKLRETQRAPSAAPAPAPEQKGDDPSQVLPSPLLAPSCEALTQDCVCLRICLSAARPREHSTLRMRSSTLPSVGCFETRRLTTPQIGGIRMERTQHSPPAWCVWHCRLCVALASDPSMLYAICSRWLRVSCAVTAQTNRLHVRGIGVHGWDGTEEGKGDYESEAALRKIFERFGYFQNAMIRHRVQNGKNTSWALVTMADEAAVERALAAHAKQPVMAGRQELVLTRFSKAQGESSTGGMKQQVSVGRFPACCSLPLLSIVSRCRWRMRSARLWRWST